VVTPVSPRQSTSPASGAVPVTACRMQWKSLRFQVSARGRTDAQINVDAVDTPVLNWVLTWISTRKFVQDLLNCCLCGLASEVKHSRSLQFVISFRGSCMLPHELKSGSLESGDRSADGPPTLCRVTQLSNDLVASKRGKAEQGPHDKREVISL